MAAALVAAAERAHRADPPDRGAGPCYGETGRIVPRSVHPHGEDFLRAKVRQLDWLTAGLPDVTWSIIACDDGCPDQPSSADLMTEIAAAEATRRKATAA